MPDKTIKSSSIKQLFQRINYQRHRHQLSNRYDSFKYLFMMLITTILIAILLKCHTVVYNYLFGPFHMNIEQFQEYLKLYKTRNYSWTYSLFREDLIQIELGENQLENRNYREQYYFNKLISSYKMVKQIKIKSTLYPNNLYVRLPAKHNFYFNKKIPYKFHKFSIKTLRCIVKNLNSYEYQSWLEKSDYIKFINEKYLNNSFEFNELVITKCGIYIGYLYSSSSYTYYADDIVLNSSEPYLTEVLFYLILFGCSIILWLLLISLFYLCSYLFTLQIIKFKINLHHDVLEYFHLLSVDHLKSFEELLFYHSSNIHESQQLFILDNYIVLFKLNTKELNFYILQRYVDQSPFCLIKINSVTWINTDGIYYKHNESTRLIRWPGQSYHQWLHQKLIETNLNYKQTYEEQVRLGREEYERELEIHSREQHRIIEDKRYQTYLHEEEEYQRQVIFDFERIIYQTTSASPRFIAQFRMKQHHIVQQTIIDDEEKCMICLEDFKLEQIYSVWPCLNKQKKEHIYHYECMLNALRSKNTCPLCRGSVEPSSTTSTLRDLLLF